MYQDTKQDSDTNSKLICLISFSNDLGPRQNLSMDVVCFIMATEIERLLKENTQLKQEIQNVLDSGLDRVNYEI